MDRHGVSSVGGRDPLVGLAAPANVLAALEELRAELCRAAGSNLTALILYGGLARGRYRPQRSDVNVAVLLRDASGPALEAIAPALRAAWRSAAVEPFILAVSEVGPAARAFPTKVQDIQAHHLVLWGEDPFSAVAVDPRRLSWEIHEKLRNLSLRLRRRFIAIAEDPAEMQLALSRVARPLALELGALLRLRGKGLPGEDRTGALFQAAAVAFDLDSEALSRLAALRQGERFEGDLASLFSRVLAAVARAADVAAGGDDAP